LSRDKEKEHQFDWIFDPFYPYKTIFIKKLKIIELLILHLCKFEKESMAKIIK